LKIDILARDEMRTRSRNSLVKLGGPESDRLTTDEHHLVA
jgi:hypothetical protein